MKVTKKTKVMMFEQEESLTERIEDGDVEQVKEFVYQVAYSHVTKNLRDIES